ALHAPRGDARLGQAMRGAQQHQVLKVESVGAAGPTGHAPARAHHGANTMRRHAQHARRVGSAKDVSGHFALRAALADGGSALSRPLARAGLRTADTGGAAEAAAAAFGLRAARLALRA